MPLPPTLPEPLLLHSCCAPCACSIMHRLSAAGITYALYFYNPNIHPEAEYLLRKNEHTALAAHLHVPVIDADYDPTRWHAAIAGQEREPERGERCSTCFLLRLTHTATYAAAHGYAAFATTLGMSRHKDLAQVDTAGTHAAAATGIPYYAYNWRGNGGTELAAQLARNTPMYRQTYCGCVYSMHRR